MDDTQEFDLASLSPHQYHDKRCPSGYTAYCYHANDADADGCDDDRWHFAVYYHEQTNTSAP
eukprot:5324865-Pyramimonas_sp.AAC.1